MNIKVIQAGIKLQNLVTSSSKLSLQQIGSQACPHNAKLIVYFIKVMSEEFLHKQAEYGNTLNFIITD